MKVWQTIRTSTLAWHPHSEAYAALVLSGEYEEAGDHGRFQVAAGCVLFHHRFEGHQNRFAQTGAVVLNLPLPAHKTSPVGMVSIDCFDDVVRVAEKSFQDAAELLLEADMRTGSQCADWPDLLVLAFRSDPFLKLSRWAEQNGLAPWEVSRGFQKVFGIAPETFRRRVRARSAWEALRNGKESLAAIASRLGFADQSHMTRCVKQLTGFPPSQWRSLQMGSRPARP